MGFWRGPVEDSLAVTFSAEPSSTRHARRALHGQTIADFLGADHRWLATRLRLVRRQLRDDQDPEASLLDALGLELQQHFEVEESTVFPLLEAVSGRAVREAVGFLREEHEEIRRSFESFRKTAEGREGVVAAFDKFRRRLATHRLREEKILYPLFDVLCPAALRELVTKRVRRQV